MAVVPKPENTTLRLVDEAIEAAQDTTQRPYLGLSQIGHPCERHLFYSFRMAEKKRFPASSIKAIQDGFAGEDVMAARLRMVKGVTLHTVNPETNKQFGFEAVGGHVRGHMDGAILGIVEAPKTWHVWEHKQVNEAKFKKLQKLIAEKGEKKALAAWDETYFAQAISYQGLTGMDRHYLTVSTPGGRDTISVRTEFDGNAFASIMQKAERVVRATVPPLRLSEDPEFYLCNWCAYKGICHGQDAPQVNCRTCCHSTPEMDGDGRWTCGKHKHDILGAAPCGQHLYIPILLEKFAEPTDMVGDGVKYAMEGGAEFINGDPPEGFTSQEIRNAKDKRILGDADVMKIRKAVPTTRVTG